MFINIINFPPVKAGKDDAFQNWFSWSNEQYSTHKGFISRKLLKPREGGNYVGVVEHETYDTFMAMHTSSTQAEARKRVGLLLEGNPVPHFHELVVS
ncbi:MAG: antibiotic biosynthesis monooxygenase [Firmicutes bacterium]|nr:antibiotic biosynthesis monooxygenase [Bacillota bacterium]